MVISLALILQGSLLTDARLEKAATFDSSLTQITDFCSQASQISGVQLKVDTGVADMKVDVFVEDRPIRETLDKVAKALNCDWVKTEAGYRLEMNVPNINRERNFNKAEDDELRASVLTKLTAYRYCAERTPGRNEIPRMGVGPISMDDRIKLLDPFRKAWEGAQKANDPAATAKAYDEYAAMSEAAGNASTNGIGRILLQMDKAALDRFWKGEPVVGSTFPNSTYKIFLSDGNNNMSSSYVDRYGKTVECDKAHCYFLRYKPDTGMITCSLNTYAVVPKEGGGGGGSSSSGGPFAYSSTNNDVSDGLKKLPFYVDLQTWMDKESLSKQFPQTINRETKDWPSIWFSGRRRLGDHLRWFHLATGIPVVAQADRSCLWSWIKLKREYTTASDYLSALMGDFGTLCKEDSGYLVARNFRYWTHRRHEAPESVWNSLEPKDTSKPITFAQCSSVALTLREDQLNTPEIGYPLSKFDARKVLTAYDSLRFLASLTEAQRTASSTGTGLAANDLSPAQNQEMQRVILKLVTGGSGCSYEMAQYLVANGLGPAVLQKMKFSMKVNHYEDNGNWIEELKDGNEVITKAGVVRGPADQILFSYGISEKETIGQFLGITK